MLARRHGAQRALDCRLPRQAGARPLTQGKRMPAAQSHDGSA